MLRIASRTMLVAALLLLPALASGQSGRQMFRPRGTDAALGNLGTVTVRHADIRGRILIASERETEQERPGANVEVLVSELSTGTILRRTRADSDGYYTLSKLDVGRYWMAIGGLRLILQVQPESPQGTELPKILIVVLPKAMLKLEP